MSEQLPNDDPLALDPPVAAAAAAIRETWSNRERWIRGAWHHFQQTGCRTFHGGLMVEYQPNRLTCRRPSVR